MILERFAGASLLTFFLGVWIMDIVVPPVFDYLQYVVIL